MLFARSVAATENFGLKAAISHSKQLWQPAAGKWHISGFPGAQDNSSPPQRVTLSTPVLASAAQHCLRNGERWQR